MLLRRSDYHIIDLSQKGRKSFPSSVYTNTIHLILKLKDLNPINTTFLKDRISKHINTPVDWANEFAEIYRYRLSNKDRKNYYNYNKALILFTNEKFKVAFEVIQTLVRVCTLFINFDIKLLQLQILLELEIVDDEFLEHQNIDVSYEIDKFRKMFDQEKETAKKPKLLYHQAYYWSIYKVYNLFYRFYRQYAWFTDGDATYYLKKDELIHAIHALQSRYYRKWFLEKLEAIQ